MQNDEKGIRFQSLAEKRTNDVINRIRILSNCSNRSAYSYTDEQVNKIFTAIDRALKEARSKFNNHKKNKFEL